MFTNRKIPAFQHKISDLADVPALTAAELKARFDACPEELRQALNGVCDDGAALEKRMDEYRAQTFAGEITREMLDAAVQAELTAKADQTALDAEKASRTSADANLQTQINARCRIAVGYYNGTGRNKTQTFLVGFKPVAVLVTSRAWTGFSFGAQVTQLIVPGIESEYLELTSNGFLVKNYFNITPEDHKDMNPFRYIAFG